MVGCYLKGQNVQPSYQISGMLRVYCVQLFYYLGPGLGIHTVQDPYVSVRRSDTGSRTRRDYHYQIPAFPRMPWRGQECQLTVLASEASSKLFIGKKYMLRQTQYVCLL